MKKPTIRFRHESISIDSVDLSDRTFSVRVGRDNSRLKNSIDACGVLSPPLLLSRHPGRGMTILCGFGRIEAIRELGISTFDAGVTSEPLQAPDGLTIAIEDNASGRGFNAAEQAVALGKLVDFGMPPQQIISSIMPLLGLGQDRFTLERSLQLAGLDTDVLLSLADGRLCKEAAFCLSSLEPDDRHRLLQLCTALPFGRNKQIELVESVLAVTTRDGISVYDLFESSGIGCLLSADEPDPCLRAEEVRRIVRARRYPRLSAWENRVQAFRRKERPLSAYRLEPPPNLEGGKIRAEFSFSSRPEFHDCLRQLDEFGASDALEEALALLRQE